MYHDDYYYASFPIVIIS